MKKIIIFVLIVMCLSFLASCDGEEPPKSDFELKQETEFTETESTETEPPPATAENDEKNPLEDGVWSKFY